MDIGYLGALLGGLLSILSPCSVMLLPAFFAYAFSSAGRLLARTAVFYLGLISTLVPLGIFASTLGALVNQHRSLLVTVAASVVIVLGLIQLLGIPLPGLTRRSATGGDQSSALSVYLLGAVYAVAGVCAGPILGSVLMVAALGGNPVYGAAMLALYALGMAVPLFVLAALWSRLGQRGRGWLRPRTVTIGPWSNSVPMIVSGVLSLAIGVLLLLTDGTASMGGIVTIDAQYAAESWVTRASAGVSNLWFLAGAAVVLVIVVLALRRQQEPRR